MSATSSPLCPGLTTRELNALRTLLEKHDFSLDEVAALDYNDLRRVPGIGPKSIDGICEWLARQGCAMRNSPGESARTSPSPRLENRLHQAVQLLERHGYEVKPPYMGSA